MSLTIRGENVRSRREVTRDVKLCILVGLCIATIFSAWVSLLFVMSGDAPFAKYGTSVAVVIFTYYGAALLIGALVGVLLPFARAGRAGAALTGIVAGMGFYASIQFALNGFSSWGPGDTFVVLVGGTLLGVPVGLAYRNIFRNGLS